MKVLVTGANGFVGRTVVKRLLAEGDTVIAAVGQDGLHEVIIGAQAQGAVRGS